MRCGPIVFDSLDRNHPTKRHRPFASGDLSPKIGGALLPILFGASLWLSFFLPISFGWLLLAYLALNLLYTFKAKRELVLDVVLLAGLYTLRILTGGIATQTPVSPWLLAFSTFFFFGLAMVKRTTDISKFDVGGVSSGRAYRTEDRYALLSLGAASSLLSVFVLALYLNSEAVTRLYHHPDRLWLIAPVLLYWLGRMWLLANRGEIHEDPVFFALKDKASWSVLLGLTIVFLIAL